MYECFGWCSLKLVLVLYVMCMGRWSEFSAGRVVRVILFAVVQGAVVMSGDVDYW